jgi:hypothetical protein
MNETEHLWLFGTSIKGSLPAELGGLVKLKELILFETALSGQLPDIFTSLKSLQRLQLAQSSFNGTIPPSLFQAQALEIISLEENKITGKLPTIVALPAIRKCFIIFVRQQFFVAAVSDLNFRSSTVSIRLGNQNPALSGPIPLEWAALTSLCTYESKYNMIWITRDIHAHVILCRCSYA